MAAGFPLEFTFIYHFLVAIGLGALIGIERELHTENQGVLVGVRTFPLVAVTGFILAYLTNLGLATVTSVSLEMLVSIGIGLAIASAFAIALLFVRLEIGQPGFTTTVALVVTYLIGALVGYSLIIEAVVVGVATTFLLASKTHLHGFATLLTEDEIIEALQFITIAFILYPLLANAPFSSPFDIFGAGGALNIANILLIVIFVSSLSFISFLIMRWQGPKRGLKFSGLLGGLVNSEAATASLCAQANKAPSVVDAAASGILLAEATSFIRNLIVATVSDPTLGTAKLLTVPLMFLSGLGAALGFTIPVKEAPKEELEVRSPFSIRFALGFAAVFLVVSAGILLIRQYTGAQGVFLIAIGALVSSAAVTASVASLAAFGQIPPTVAAETILLACAISSINKLLIARGVSKSVLIRGWKQMSMVVIAIIATTVILFFLVGG